MEPESDITQLVEKEDIGGLVSLLSHEDENVRENAARSVGEFAEHGKARELAEAGAIPALMRNLEEPGTRDPTFFLLALAMIARWGEARAVVAAGALPVFLGFLDKEKPFWVRGAAVKALVAIAKGDELEAALGSGTLETFAGLLKEELTPLRALAVMALGELREKSAVADLEELAGTESDETIREAAERLAKKLRGSDPMRGHLRDDDSAVRLAAVVSLGMSGDRRDIRTLEELLRNEADEDVRKATQEVLEKLKRGTPVGRDVTQAAREGFRKLKERSKNHPSS